MSELRKMVWSEEAKNTLLDNPLINLIRDSAERVVACDILDGKRADATVRPRDIHKAGAMLTMFMAYFLDSNKDDPSKAADQFFRNNVVTRHNELMALVYPEIYGHDGMVTKKLKEKGQTL